MNPTSEPDVTKLGAAKGTYHVKFGLAYVGIYAVCLALCGVGLIIVFGTSGWERIASSIPALFLSTPLIFLLWRTIPTVFDELRVYEKGFSYRSRKGLQTCLWTQIKDQDSILDTDNRVKFTCITTKKNEVIRFAFKIRGLDVLAHEFESYEYSNIPDSEKISEAEAAKLRPTTLGELQATYHTAKNAVLLVPMAALLLVAGFGILLPIANENWWLAPACSLPMAIPFVVFTWTFFRTKNDELQVFKNGFAYRTGGETVTCLWDEIVDYSTARRSSKATGVKKEDGKWINFAFQMQGIEDLQPHLRTVVTWKGPEE
ncbi:MAG TPA: hypothetical protein PLR83_09285 [Pyrinomonadaceae bacterium]|nr:hypothetical protein [Pyrinomonadaceae bacterium]